MADGPKVASLVAEVEGGLAALIAAGRSRLADLEDERRRIDLEIAAQRRNLRTWEHAHGSLKPEAARRHLRLARTEKLPSKREAVLAFLSENPAFELKLVDLRRGLIERGWMTPDSNSIHALEVAVATMTERGEIHRVRRGYYKLSPDMAGLSEDASPSPGSSWAQ